MFRPRIGQQILFAALLGLVLSPAMSWASTVVVPRPFAADPSLPSPFNNNGNPGQPPYTAPVPSTSVINSITINNDGSTAPAITYFGTLNLNNNDLILIPAVQTEAAGEALYNKVNDMVRSGFNGGTWNGTGIQSAPATIDGTGTNNTAPNAALGIGVLYNGDGFGGEFYGPNGDINPTWDGYSGLSQFDTLVKYTFYGDTFLRGFIDAADITDTFANLGFAGGLNTWENGDFFYQTTSGSPTNSADYTTAFANATVQLQYPKAYSSATTDSLMSASVPEPSSTVLAFLAAALIGGVRMVRRRKLVVA